MSPGTEGVTALALVLAGAALAILAHRRGWWWLPATGVALLTLARPAETTTAATVAHLALGALAGAFCAPRFEPLLMLVAWAAARGLTTFGGTCGGPAPVEALALALPLAAFNCAACARVERLPPWLAGLFYGLLLIHALALLATPLRTQLDALTSALFQLALLGPPLLEAGLRRWDRTFGAQAFVVRTVYLLGLAAAWVVCPR